MNRVHRTSRLISISGTILSLIAGLLVGVMIHYTLYRLSLPSKPFIYVAF